MGLSLHSQIDGQSVISTPESGSVMSLETELLIPWPSITHTLRGVVAATKASDGEHEAIVRAVAAVMNKRYSAPLLHAGSSLGSIDLSLSLRDWILIAASTSLEVDAQHRAKLAVVLTFMSCSGRQGCTVCPEDLDYVWSVVHDALSNSSIPFTVSRSAQGFFAIPLWALLEDGNIDELFRLHVWLPDGKRGNPDLAVHPHQAFAQSWILTGKGRNSTFDAEDADPSTATHAEYALAWSDGNGENKGEAYQVYQKFSTVVNTGKLVRVTPNSSEVHSRNETYVVPSGRLHSSKIDSDALHATLFFFDASRGFQQYAPVLGPVNGPPHVQHRDPAGITTSSLVRMVESVRTWELSYDQGIEHMQRGDCESALRTFRRCLDVCSSDEETFTTPRYRRLALREIESVCEKLDRAELTDTHANGAFHSMALHQQQVDTRMSLL